MVLCQTLSLSLSKTSYMIFSEKKLLNTNFTISLGREHLNRVTETKFLGLALTEDLKWRKQINTVVKKISKVVGILYRVSHILDTDKLKKCYIVLCLNRTSPTAVLSGDHLIKMVILTESLEIRKGRLESLHVPST